MTLIQNLKKNSTSLNFVNKDHLGFNYITRFVNVIQHAKFPWHNVLIIFALIYLAEGLGLKISSEKIPHWTKFTPDSPYEAYAMKIRVQAKFSQAASQFPNFSKKEEFLIRCWNIFPLIRPITLISLTKKILNVLVQVSYLKTIQLFKKKNFF